MYPGEVTERMLAMSETGVLIPMCAWCARHELDGEWVQPPGGAIEVIDVRNAVSHSICLRARRSSKQAREVAYTQCVTSEVRNSPVPPDENSTTTVSS